MTRHYEAEVLPGLEPFAAAELAGIDRIRVLRSTSGAVPFEYDGPEAILAGLRAVGAVYRVLTFDVPRPKALLGHQHFTAIAAAARDIVAGQPSFRTLSLDAAGADSSVMQRIRDDLAHAAAVAPTHEKGDLHVRVRPGSNAGWQVLMRLTSRPLATRPWRLHNVPGALNATVASAMASLTVPAPADRVLNLFCGSASLMIERALLADAALVLGVDNDSAVLDLAHDHLRAAGLDAAALVCGDVTRLPIATESVDVLLADFPFGQLVGSHRANLALYPAALNEAARVALPDARFALITHEKRLITDVIRLQAAWSVERRIPINLNGLHPDILLLRRQT